LTTIVGIAGSLRKSSYNRALLRAAAALAPDGLEVQIASIEGIPLYDGDREQQTGVPDEVAALKEAMVAADGLLLVTPEYNNSLPGVLKNAVDWLSRPPKDIARVFGDKPVAIMGATPGRGGTRMAQIAWLPVLRTLGMRLWTGKQLYVGGAGEAFEKGELADPKIRELVADFMAGFARFVA
jgi:NAD(P)H-dependent FMN reductase